jgi:hypothetical protein
MEMSKITIADLTNETELSSAAMSKLVGGMSCQAADAIAGCDALTAHILNLLGDPGASSYFSGHGKGVLDGACPA